LSSQSSNPQARADFEPGPTPVRPLSLRWALRRALLGLILLIVLTALGVWLFYASIEPDEAAAGSPVQSEDPSGAAR
jgi:hypothetical protein